MVDDGETLTRDLIRSKLAAGGRIRVVDQSFEIVKPEPASPGRRRSGSTHDILRRIDVILRRPDLARNLSLRGRPAGDLPADEARGAPPRHVRGPCRIGPHAVAAQVSLRFDRAPRTGFLRNEEGGPGSAPATAAATRRPTESEIARVRDLFKGNWDIVSILDDGQSLGPELIRRKSAQSGRVQFGTRAFATTDPRTEERRIWAYRIDPSKNPSQIDVTTQFDSVLKGIYTFEGDALSVCVAKHEDGARPRRSRPRAVPTACSSDSSWRHPTEAGPFRAPPSSSAESDEAREARIRRLIVGSWAMTDPRGTLTIVFHQGGTFSGTRVYSRSAKTMLGPAYDWAKGEWSFGDGTLQAYVATTTDRNLVSHSRVRPSRLDR